QVLFAQTLNERDKFRSQALRRTRRLRTYDRHLASEGGIAKPMIETTALERVMDFARAVGGDDDDRRFRRRHDADFRNRHLEVGQDLEQVGFKGLVGAVDLVDKE